MLLATIGLLWVVLDVSVGFRVVPKVYGVSVVLGSVVMLVTTEEEEGVVSSVLAAVAVVAAEVAPVTVDEAPGVGSCSVCTLHSVSQIGKKSGQGCQSCLDGLAASFAAVQQRIK